MARSDSPNSIGEMSKLSTEPLKVMGKHKHSPEREDETIMGAKVARVSERKITVTESPRKIGSVQQGAEGQRLNESVPWRTWGPYLSERQWATVREDRSSDGNCWDFFPHMHAVFRAYEGGEDGLLGLSDDQARLCLAVGLWNGKDPIIKERLFGLTSTEGNHGEDVKEIYHYLDSTPTHSYMKANYKYPQSEFPYKDLVVKNAARTKLEEEYEIIDTGVFDKNAYWDVFVEYAKQNETDVLIRYTVHNRGKAAATLHVLPTLWFRNTWQKSLETQILERPSMKKDGTRNVKCSGLHSIGEYHFAFDESANATSPPRLLFTNNDTNIEQLEGIPETSPDSKELIVKIGRFSTAVTKGFYKDAFHELVIHGKEPAVNSANKGTKCAAWYKFTVQPGASATARCRLTHKDNNLHGAAFGKPFDDLFAQRITEADVFYEETFKGLNMTKEEQLISRQAYAGLCWTKQYYFFDGKTTVTALAAREAAQGRKTMARKSRWRQSKANDPMNRESVMNESFMSNDSASKIQGTGLLRNSDWMEMQNSDVISMPDKWEFPWYATWDLAFHAVAFAGIDPNFAKCQLLLMLSDRYQHRTGMLPAYEFNFSDVNPPVHAWACLRVYRQSDERDVTFLKKCFNKLIINFAWWVNEKDPHGKNLYGGGFLGMDNVSCLERSNPPHGLELLQADATGWMAFYAACMLDMALELADEDDSYEELAITYLSFYAGLADAINEPGGTRKKKGLWHEKDGFYYDRLVNARGKSRDVRMISMIGIVCLFPALTLHKDRFKHLPAFTEKLKNVLPSFSGGHTAPENTDDSHRQTVLLSLVSQDQLRRILHYVLDTNELLSPFGIRAMSKRYDGDNEFRMEIKGTQYTAKYTPGVSDSGMFGGNSNWRGPIWLCMNHLLIESLDVYDDWYGDKLKVALPSGSQHMSKLGNVAEDIGRRMMNIFLQDGKGRRPVHGSNERYATDPNFKDMHLFYEYFNAETGAGCGASHQTGWTALIACIIKRVRERHLVKH